MSVDPENNLIVAGFVTDDTNRTVIGVVKYKDAACAPLEVEELKQCDLPWGPEHYDRTSPPATICDQGCALTSLAMLNNFYREKFSLDIASHTPLTMNQALLALGRRGYWATSIVWRGLIALTSSNILEGDSFTQDPREDGKDTACAPLDVDIGVVKYRARLCVIRFLKN